MWVGALLAAVNGYPVQVVVTLGASLLTFVLLGWAFSGGGAGREVLTSLMGGWGASQAGYYLNSGHWASELLVLGVLFTLALLMVLLSQGFLCLAQDVAAGRRSLVTGLGLAGGALGYTIINILLIAGVVFCLHFPATPLPFQPLLWISIILAVINQECIKRKFYRHQRRQVILWGLSSAAYLSLVSAFLVITGGRL